MDLEKLSKHFAKMRATSDWQEFEAAAEKLLRSAGCAELTRSVAPLRGMDLGDLFTLLAGFVQSEESNTNSQTVKLAYKSVYEYDDGRPTLTLDESPECCTIHVGDQTFHEEIQLFKLERGTVKLKYGRAKLAGITGLNQLIESGRSTAHRIVFDGHRESIPIVFFNVVTETAKYTGERTTFADFLILS